MLLRKLRCQNKLYFAIEYEGDTLLDNGLFLTRNNKRVPWDKADFLEDTNISNEVITRMLQVKDNRYKYDEKRLELHNIIQEQKYNTDLNRVFNVSFYDGSYNKEQALYIIARTDKPIIYTHGLSFRRPTTYKKPITREMAISIIKDFSLIDIDFGEKQIHINTYSDNDMY